LELVVQARQLRMLGAQMGTIQFLIQLQPLEVAEDKEVHHRQ